MEDDDENDARETVDMWIGAGMIVPFWGTLPHPEDGLTLMDH